MIEARLIPDFERFLTTAFAKVFPGRNREIFFAQLAQRGKIKPLTLEQKLNIVTACQYCLDLKAGKHSLIPKEMRGRGRPKAPERYVAAALAELFHKASLVPCSAWNEKASTRFAKFLCFFRKALGTKSGALGNSDEAFVKTAQRELKEQMFRKSFHKRQYSQYPELAELDRLANERVASGSSNAAAYDFILSQTPEGQALYASYIEKSRRSAERKR
jgi:hypothetical protein